MDRHSILTAIWFNAAIYALAFGAGLAVVNLLAGPWRRAAAAHWTERARLAFAPGSAVLWLAVVLPVAGALLGAGCLEYLAPGSGFGLTSFCLPWVAGLVGVLTARYFWLRELWGPRVTLRSWLAGCLVVMLLLVPHFLIMVGLAFALPDNPNWRAAAFFAVALVAVAFFARGGGLLLLRWLGVVRPAPHHVTEMVEALAGDMRVPLPVRVFELEWAQVNAVAWVLYRAVAFSRPMLELMNPDEVRAIAAHELAHLLEPARVRVVRVIHMFAYLLVAPVMRYGGALGVPLGWVLMVAIALAYRRFARRLEARADQLEREAIRDPDAYTRSLVKLHQLNMMPAVLPGKRTHPDLYDRLLAGGIQPDFPRPKAPSRIRSQLAVLAATAAALLLMVFTAAVASLAGLGERTSRITANSDPTADLPARFKTQEAVPCPDFRTAAEDPKFQQAVKEIAALFGAEPQPLRSEAENELVKGGISFDVPADRLEPALFKAHTNLLSHGFYLFRYHRGFSIGGQPDKAGLLPTRDKYAVMAAMQTNGDNYQIGTAGVIAWMKELEQEQPFVLTGIGFDFLEGRFTSPVKDARGLARRMEQFCPDIVSQGTGNLAALAWELKKGKIYFWWD